MVRLEEGEGIIIPPKDLKHDQHQGLETIIYDEDDADDDADDDDDDLVMTMMMICFLPNGPQTQSAPGGTVNYDDDGDDNYDDEGDDVDDNNDDDDDTRCFKASVHLFQGIENVGLLAVKLVLNLTLTHMSRTETDTQFIVNVHILQLQIALIGD